MPLDLQRASRNSRRETDVPPGLQIVPASGDYEWRPAEEGKQPYFISAVDGAVLIAGGDEWRDPQNSEADFVLHLDRDRGQYDPSIMTREALEAAKRAEAIALEILNAEVRWLVARHDDNRAQAECVIHLHGGQARRQHCRGHLAALRTGNGVSPFKVCRAMTNEPIVRPFRPVSNRSMAFHSNAFSKTYKILAD
jgi:hypothetical protein